jgi:signal transduction histidine kinase/ligand-binding sensor domain-containing protein
MLFRRLKRVLLILAWMMALIPSPDARGSSGQAPEADQTGGKEPASLLDDYAVTRWQAADGLPEDFVVDLMSSRDGYLWCLTAKSLSRFDGMKFERVSLPEVSKGPSWYGMTETRAGALWVYGDSGAFSYVPRTPGQSPWARSPTPPLTPVLRIVQQSKTNLWALLSSGLYQIEGGSTRVFELPNDIRTKGAGVKAAERELSSRVWLAADCSLLSFNEGHYQEEKRFDRPVELLSINRYGLLWAATSTELYCRGKDGVWLAIPPPPHRNYPRWRMTCLAGYGDGELWVGTTSGLYRWHSGRWSELTPRDGFYPLEIQCVARDADGNLWAGTSGGLLCLRRRVVQVHDSGLGLLKHTFTAILPDPAIGLRIGVAGGGLLEGKPGAFRPVKKVPVSRTAVISALLKSKDGALWIGTQGDYLWRCFEGRADCIAEPSREENSAVNINALLEDRQGRIWAGTGNGVMIYNPGKGQLEPLQQEGLSVAVHAFLEDREGVVWVGLQGEGVARIALDGGLVKFDREQGLPASTVLSLCQDVDGIVWAGTSGGLARWDGTQWAAITELHGLPEGPVSQILEEDASLWLGTRYGIACISRADLAEVASGQKSLVTPQLFGRNEGMRDEQCSSGFGNLAARDTSGQLWFSTVDGLVMIDPKRVIEKGSGGGRGYIEEVKAGETLLRSLSDGLSHMPFSVIVPAGAGTLSIRYSAPAFTAPEQVQFKRMLEGYDPMWSSPTSLRTVTYPRLPPGKYRFRLMAGRGGSWLESSQTVSVEVKPFYWQRREFWGVTGILALGLVGLWARALEKRRSRRQLLMMEQAQALERERSRIARDLHDDLGASLTEIGLMSAVALRPSVSAERARNYLEDITRKVRGLVETLDEIVWAVNPRNDNVTSLGDYFCECAQRILQLTPIRCRLDLARDLPDCPLDPDRRHTLFLAFSEALNNVIRHSGAGEVRIRIWVEKGHLLVSVADDGCGFEGQPPDSLTGEGLRSMRHRVEQMGGRFTLTSRAGQGTTIQFDVPLK